VKKKLLSRLGSALVLVAAVSAISIGSSAEARRFCGFFYCLDVWDPVLCPDGNVYGNSCYAARACQTNCVRIGNPTE
jgi:hypothetical protein